MAYVENPGNPLVARLEGVHLFHFDGAPCAQRVRFALHEKGLMRGREERFDADEAASCQAQPGHWVSRQVSLVRKQHMTPFYAGIQPNLVVPALVHDGRLYIESMEIIEYLDEAFGGAPLVPRQDPVAMAEAEQLTKLGEELHRSIRFVTFRWGLRGLARLSDKEEANLRLLLDGAADAEQLVSFYDGYDHQTIPDSVYHDHLAKLNQAFAAHEQQLQDGRQFLTGDAITMADIIWAMKTLRLLECDYPFDDCFPACAVWFRRVSERPAFVEGVMGKHRMMNRAFKIKARLEGLLGIGLKKEVLKQVA